MKNPKGILTMLIALIGVVVFICFCEGIKISTDNVFSLLLAFVFCVGVFCGIVFLLLWTDKSKEEHEKRPKDGSINYRLSQFKYLIALLIAGLFILWIIFCFFRGLLIPGVDN
jgi:formate hydrogenlyase subunit 3/multisubunit Na+/H+ antiporter MnhD subunit